MSAYRRLLTLLATLLVITACSKTEEQQNLELYSKSELVEIIIKERKQHNDLIEKIKLHSSQLKKAGYAEVCDAFIPICPASAIEEGQILIGQGATGLGSSQYGLWFNFLLILKFVVLFIVLPITIIYLIKKMALYHIVEEWKKFKQAKTDRSKELEKERQNIAQQYEKLEASKANANADIEKKRQQIEQSILAMEKCLTELNEKKFWEGMKLRGYEDRQNEIEEQIDKLEIQYEQLQKRNELKLASLKGLGKKI